MENNLRMRIYAICILTITASSSAYLFGVDSDTKVQSMSEAERLVCSKLAAIGISKGNYGNRLNASLLLHILAFACSEKYYPVKNLPFSDSFDIVSCDENSLAVLQNQTTINIITSDRLHTLGTLKSTVLLKRLVALSNRKIAAITHREDALQIWDIDSGVCLHTLSCDGPIAAVVPFESCHLAAGLKEEGIEIWCFTEGTLIKTLKMYEKRSELQSLVALSNNKLASLSHARNAARSKLWIWNISSGEGSLIEIPTVEINWKCKLAALPPHQLAISLCTEFSDPPSYLLIVDSESGACTKLPRGKGVAYALMALPGNRLAFAYTEQSESGHPLIDIVDYTKMQTLQTIRHGTLCWRQVRLASLSKDSFLAWPYGGAQTVYGKKIGYGYRSSSSSCSSSSSASTTALTEPITQAWDTDPRKAYRLKIY